ncbi:ATP-dependent helicase, partial [Streptomyces xiamenensis]
MSAAVFLPADPPRASEVAFWSPDGAPPELPGRLPPSVTAEPRELTVALPADGGTVTAVTVPALVLPVRDALPLLTRARSGSATGSAAFWGAAAVLALQLAARGRLLPGLSAQEHDAWRLGPLEGSDAERLRELADAMPVHAHAVPLPGHGPDDPPLLPAPHSLLRAFLDAVADTLPRTPAAALAAGGAPRAPPAGPPPPPPPAQKKKKS